MFLNNSNIESILNYTFYGLRQLGQLHLENNNIRRLEGHEFLSLRGNQILQDGDIITIIIPISNCIIWVQQKSFKLTKRLWIEAAISVTT